jgi:hypothetical protein
MIALVQLLQSVPYHVIGDNQMMLQAGLRLQAVLDAVVTSSDNWSLATTTTNTCTGFSVVVASPHACRDRSEIRLQAKTHPMASFAILVTSHLFWPTLQAGSSESDSCCSHAQDCDAKRRKKQCLWG